MSRRGTARAFPMFAALWVVAAGAGAGGAEAQTATRPEVIRLQFEGNEAFPARTLANAIVTRESSCRSFVLRPFCWFDADFAMDPAFLNPRILEQDRVRLFFYYSRRGYRGVSVETEVERIEPTRAEVTFRIVEGDPVRIARFEVRGVERVDGPPVDGGLPVALGDPLDDLRMEMARDTLTRRLQDRGYPHAEVFRDIDIPAGSLDAELAFDVYPGPRARFGEIVVEGNREVSERVVRRMLPFEEGSLYSRERIFEGQRNLFGLEVFRHASIQEDLEHLPDSIVPLRVLVNEGSTRRVRAGGGWTTADCFTAESRWASRNFVGGARRLVLRGRVSNLLTSTLDESLCTGAGTGEFARLNWLASAEFSQPWLLSPRNAFSSGVFVERQSVPDIFVRESLGLTLALTRTVGRASPLTLSYQPQIGRLSAAEVFFCTSFLICVPQEIDILQATNRLSPVGLRFSTDRTDRALAPTSGYSLAAEVEHASRFTASDFEYERVVAEATRFWSTPGDAVLGARLRGGWLGADAFRGFEGTELEGISVAHPQKRFYAGGANSVRGFAQNQLGPRVVTIGVERLVLPDPATGLTVCLPEEVADLTCDASPLADGAFESRPIGGTTVLEGSLELRFPVWAPLLSGVAFVDGGQVWAESSSLRLDDLVFTPGMGLRYTTPVGPIRVDVAYRPAARQLLPVVTTRIRPFRPGDDPADRLRGPNDEPIDWVLTDELARLQHPVPFEETPGFSFRRLQLQFSIGHAF